MELSIDAVLDPLRTGRNPARAALLAQVKAHRQFMPVLVGIEMEIIQGHRRSWAAHELAAWVRTRITLGGDKADRVLREAMAADGRPARAGLRDQLPGAVMLAWHDWRGGAPVWHGRGSLMSHVTRLLKREARHPKTVDPMPHGESEDTDQSPLQWQASPEPGPEEAVLGAEARRETLATLTSSQGEIATLLERGTPFEEIAQMRGTTVDAVYSTMSQARARLRRTASR